MKKFRKILLLIGLIVTLGGMNQIVSANEFNFSVTPVRPENQIGQSGYFNLQMTPGQTQVLTVTLTNSTEKTVVVEESIATATTNINGVIEYSPNKIQADKTLKYNISDYAKIPAEITLTPKSSQQVKIEVAMPNEAFKGVIAGGITFKEKGADEENSKSKGISIQNKYAYVVALLMQQDPEPVAPDLKLTSVSPGQVNYRNVINANLQNPNAGYLNQMYVQATIKGVTNTKLSYTTDKEMMQMAPNTNFDYPVIIGEGKRIEAGKYQLKMTVYGQKSDNGKYVFKDAQGKEQKFDYQWQFSQDFTISGDTAKKLNAKDVTIKPVPWYKNWIIWAGIILVLLSLFFLFFLVWKRRKNDDEDEGNGAEKEDIQSQIEAIREQLKD